MKQLLILVVLVALGASCNHQSEEIPLFIGTYTDGESEGIYRMTFSEQNGTLSNPVLLAEAVNPSFIALNNAKDMLYAVSEVGDFESENSGYVSAYSIADDGTLSLINRTSSQGAHPCHIGLNDDETLCVVSNYSGGTFSVIPVDKLKGVSQSVFESSLSLDSLASHAHSGFFLKNSIYIADLGRDAIFQYSEGHLNYNLENTITIEKGAGPRHMARTTDGKYLYVINEYANSVNGFRIESSKPTLIGSWNTLTPGFKGESFCADIHISSDNRFVYGSNRGENTLVVFKRDLSNGVLNAIQHVDVDGDWPRNFVISPSGKFILVANQKSESITVFTVDQTTGKLTRKARYDFPSPVCLKF